MIGSHLEIVGLTQNRGGLLDGTACLGEAPFIDRQLMAPGVDGLSQTFHPQIGKFLRNGFQAHANIVEFSSHEVPRVIDQDSPKDSSPQ